MPRTSLDARLGAAAAYVRQEAYFADIGTDHAYLPVFLLEEGRIHRAIAADIGEGPLANAAATVREAGKQEQVELILTDGLAGIAARGVTDIAICGMGGELIASILDAAPFVRDPHIRLILQPMSRPAHLRRYLAQEGYEILSETLCRAGGRLYACLCAEFRGTPYALTPAEALLGACNIRAKDASPLWRDYLRSNIDTVRRRALGLRAGGEDACKEEQLIEEMERYT